MPLTARSQFLTQLFPALRAGIRRAHLQACHADDALQQSLDALLPHVEQLAAMSEQRRSAYVFLVASRTAMALRKRIGLERASGTDEEVDAWDREVSQRGVTPEQLLRAEEGATRAARVFGGLGTIDQELVLAINDDGLSEREAARKLGMSRGSVAYRLRLARDALARAWLGTTSWGGRTRKP